MQPWENLKAGSPSFAVAAVEKLQHLNFNIIEAY